MFREMRRFKQQISEEKCIELLKQEPRGILSVLGDEDYPYGVPMDFFYDEKEHGIYFHCARQGHKLDAISRHDKCTFCIYDQGFQKEGEWLLHIQSVIVFGRIHIVEDEGKRIEKVRAIGRKYYPEAAAVEEEIARGADCMCILKMKIEHMTGKLVKES